MGQVIRIVDQLHEEAEFDELKKTFKKRTDLNKQFTKNTTHAATCSESAHSASS